MSVSDKPTEDINVTKRMWWKTTRFVLLIAVVCIIVGGVMANRPNLGRQGTHYQGEFSH